MISSTFADVFRHLTGNLPYPWQENLYQEFCLGKYRDVCAVPTGLGKTSIIPIWLVALAHCGKSGIVPRRLIYIVNRRTVVDQATKEAEALREKLLNKPELAQLKEKLAGLAAVPGIEPLAVSTLRGAFADNGAWLMDPARAAVVVGTVDMIGSRLLFSGYGRSFRSRPWHAGFLGQDALVAHDEAHLEPALQRLLEAVAATQRAHGDYRPLKVMALTATARTSETGEPLLSERDLAHSEVRKRLFARKGLRLTTGVASKELAEKVANCALAYRDSGSTVAIYLQSLELVSQTVKLLKRESQQVVTLTGTMRGLERDSLVAENPLFARFTRESRVESADGTVYLVCTSAGEIGINSSADHAVMDLTSYDSMAQRLGRVNRFGTGDAVIDVVAADVNEAKAAASDNACATPEAIALRTYRLLAGLPVREDGLLDASPEALRSLPETERLACFSPPPGILPTTDILFDNWALTTPLENGTLVSKEPVAPWLHGLTSWTPPETAVAWRSEVELIAGDLLEAQSPKELLLEYPLFPHELLRDRSSRVAGHLARIAQDHPELPLWIVQQNGEVEVTTFAALAALPKKGAQKIEECTVLLPPKAGALSELGLLEPGAKFSSTLRYDVSDLHDAEGQLLRCRIMPGEKIPAGMRMSRSITLQQSAADGEEGEEWIWCRSARCATNGDPVARYEMQLCDHAGSAGFYADKIGQALGLDNSEARALRTAAIHHDCGKDRRIWQRGAGNFSYPASPALAKSAQRKRLVDIGSYRHELVSLRDADFEAAVARLAPQERDLALHLVAAHHGRARPHFRPSEHHGFDGEAISEEAHGIVCRFARLQERYGRWGLAYLESLLRSADALASQFDMVVGKEEQIHA